MRTFPKMIDNQNRDPLIWDNILKGRLTSREIVHHFLFGTIDIYDIQSLYPDDSTNQMKRASVIVLNALSTLSLENITSLIREETEENCYIDTIPIFSSLDVALNEELPKLTGKKYTFIEIGDKLSGTTSDKPQAKYKYGETHSKLLALIGTVWITKADKLSTVELSPIGNEILCYSKEEREILLTKMMFKIPIIRNAYRSNCTSYSQIKNEVSKWANGTTINRRSSSVLQIMKMIYRYSKRLTNRKHHFLYDYDCLANTIHL